MKISLDAYNVHMHMHPIDIIFGFICHNYMYTLDEPAADILYSKPERAPPYDLIIRNGSMVHVYYIRICARQYYTTAVWGGYISYVYCSHVYYI